MDVPQKPPVMPVQAGNIPEILKGLDRWVGWRWTWNGKKFDKPPLRVRMPSQFASSTNQSTWASFNEALAAHHAGTFDGIGFTLGKTSSLDIVGVDLDDCVIAGQIQPDAIYLASFLDSYAEISPSGTGIKIFVSGQLLFKDGAQKKKTDQLRNVEFYDAGRYFTVTGHRLEGFPQNVNERTQQISELHALVFPAPFRTQEPLDDREVALSALAGLKVERASGYDSWLRIGMALFTISPDLLTAWDQWSQKCPEKYVAGACEKKWQSFKKGGLGIGSLIHWAKEDGWEFTDALDARSRSRSQSFTEETKKHETKKHETNGKHAKKSQPGKEDQENSDDEEISSQDEQPRFNTDTAGQKDNDPTMGDGLTDHEGARTLAIANRNVQSQTLLVAISYLGEKH